MTAYIPVRSIATAPRAHLVKGALQLWVLGVHPATFGTQGQVPVAPFEEQDTVQEWHLLGLECLCKRGRFFDLVFPLTNDPLAAVLALVVHVTTYHALGVMVTGLALGD
jgi:hypothetical protein